MKRFVLPTSALVLVVTACGAGAKPAPQATDAGGRVPAATRVIVVHAPRKSSLTVTSPAKVAQIVRWFDDLRHLRHRAVACPLVLRPEITLSFRGPGGTQLAHARVPTPVAGVCDPIRFRSGAKPWKLLIAPGSGTSLARRLQRLLERGTPQP